MISLIEFCSFACLICFQTIDLTSARLAPSQKFSFDSAATPNSIQNRSTSPPFEELVPIGTLWGGATGDWFGWSVSLSYDGDELAVGSPEHDEGELSKVGLVQFFNRQNTSQWVEVWNATGGNEYDKFGWSTSLSGDGKWLAVGTLQRENGYVKLVETETGKENKIDGGESDDYFGRRVAVSHDGNRTAVAAAGHVRVFGKEEDGSIYQIGEDILSEIGDNIPTNFLSTVIVLSADGETLAIGEYSYDNWKGRVRIFEWNSGQWKQVGGDIVGENENDVFGHSLDITADGHRVVIRTGKYFEVYDYDGSKWEVVGGKLFGGFGSSVSISDDGSRIVIGSPYFDSDGIWFRGRAAVYQFESGDWNQVGDDILGMNAHDSVGWSVAISGDGNIISIGAPGADSYRGYVMMYEIN